MSLNGIAHLPSKELKQKAKLDLASIDRAAVSNPRSTYDITLLPTQYSGNIILDNTSDSNVLTPGRPWIASVSFAVYEAFNTTSALSTTQYASGNKIYVYSSSLDVPSYGNAVIKSNDVVIYNGASRGHTLALLDTYGDLISVNTYDTYGSAGSLTSLANALNAAASGTIAVLTVWDASALNSTVRSALTTNYGATAPNTWTSSRVDHIFIGIKV